MITSAALAVYLVELLKEFVQWVSKNPGFEFAPKYMAALLVLANAASAVFLAFLGVEGYSIPTDWVAWTKAIVVAALSALVSSALYTFGYKPFKAYAARYKAARAK